MKESVIYQEIISQGNGSRKIPQAFYVHVFRGKIKRSPVLLFNSCLEILTQRGQTARENKI